MNIARNLAGFGNVEAVLHPHQRIHRNSKSLFDPQRHDSGQIRPLVQQCRQGGAGNTQNLGGSGNGQI